MKNSIVYLGIMLLAFTNVNHASEVFKNQDNASQFKSVESVTTAQNEALLPEEVIFNQKKFGPDEDTVIFDPLKVIALNLEKPIEEIIAENNKIIESSFSNEVVYLYSEKPIEDVIAENNQIIESKVATAEVHFIFIDKAIEDIIAEDNQIIESIVPNEIQLLDFEK
ncbi:hypothetical protein [Flavobacterium sp.]|uniref:hypothetical protein n=1 Tax=Flavobacterium sp. TaxID=239 RepID=UPI002B4B7F56|nr:hypothetical protein [Flavobacterium sp.]HLF52987.1 hypothetical protein [Flavobacterium sp.]